MVPDCYENVKYGILLFYVPKHPNYGNLAFIQKFAEQSVVYMDDRGS